MKDNIKTAEQVLKDWYNPLHGISEIALLQITEAMKQYSEQFIDLASDTARINYRDILYNKEEVLYEYRGYEGYDDDPILVNINQESILNVKKFIK